MTITEYLAVRAQGDDVGAAKVASAIPVLAAAGAQIDALLVQAEGVKALATREEASRFEETVQTLGALSREIWAAHTAALNVAGALKQLADVEARLKANLVP